MKTTIVSLSKLALLFVLTSGPLFAQLITSSIVGRITDQSGAVVPDALVIVRNLDKGTEMNAKTDATGNYSVLDLLPDAYQVTVQKNGFRSFSVTGLQLAAQQTARQDVQLRVGAMEETVEVNGSVPLLRTDSAAIGSSITARQVEELPTSMISIDAL